MSDLIQLSKQLIEKPSISPEDYGCQDIMIERLETIGFKIERLPYGDVHNFWARRGNDNPVFAFAGHTDVVPSGPIEQWHSNPFKPEIRDGLLYGRGAADMKGSLAAMIIAVETFIKNHPNHTGSIAFLITSDEEDRAIDGTRRVVEHLEERGEKITWCLVGEPSSTEVLGDVIKNGRRGSLSGKLTVYGHQGHVAYPHLADNPIHHAAPVLTELCATQWDPGNQYFPATTFQISNIHAGSGASNVIPGDCVIDFNFRYSPETNHNELKEHVENILNRCPFDHQLQWILFGEPFYTQEAELVRACQTAVSRVTGHKCSLSTSGGTSDGRFIAPTGAQVVELGPVNATIHKINEHVRVDDLKQLPHIYNAILENLLT